ncbi:MAG: putative ribosomally synthesized peptide with nif11-like leader [Glaciecola sp.]|jgi:predicted ribosomally synthesized peptide with nif11-like leader|uniref:Nif11-like leader peptide family RiPP precursor n=1 Tax=Congregibacter sp. TaxID=2744308 RepID=UPI0039E4F53B
MTDQFSAFKEKIAASTDLQQKVVSSIGDLNSMADIARQEGCDISFDDLKHDLQNDVSAYRDKPEVKAFVAEFPEAHRFYYQAFNDAKLHSSFVAANGDIEKLAVLAKEQGFELDASQLGAFRDGLIEATSTDELSDDELDAVAGGGLIGAFLGGVIGGATGFLGGFAKSVIDGKYDDVVSGSFRGASVGAIGGAVSGALLPEP